MKKCLIIAIFICFLVFPVSALEFNLPSAPDSAEIYMPEDNETFGEGLWYIIRSALKAVKPEITDAMELCMSLIATVLLLSIYSSFSEKAGDAVRLTGAVVIGLLLLQPINTMIRLGTATVTELSEYGKLLLPVMTAAVAAQGGTTSSATLYTGTVFFDALLTGVVVKLMVPALYIYLCMSVACSALAQDMLKKVQKFLKWIITSTLKWILYIFCGYMSITGVISGSVDASALKLTKLTISGVVPVVGGILSDASETILVSAGTMKNAAGIYGIFALLAICVSPFVQIGVQYILLKLSGAICNIFGYKPAVDLLQDFSTGMGIVLAMTGTLCLLLLVSIVCFMKGMG